VVNAKKAAYGIAAAAMGGGLIIPALSASAATQYHDTSVQAGQLTSHAITGTAGARNVISGTGTTDNAVKVSGLDGVGGTTTPLVYTLKSRATIDGVTLSLFTDGSAASGGNTVISATGTPTATGASEDGTVVLDATDSDGDVAIVSVPVVVGANSVQLNGTATTDEVSLVSATDDNTTGSVVFTTSPAGARVTESNLPRGLASGNPLKPGDAVPGNYQGVDVKATDRAGAVATGSLSIKVNGRRVSSHPTPPGHGQPTPPGHGQPTPPSGHGSHGYVVNTYSGKCLDATNTFGRARTTELQLWSCGAAGGEDQIFTYTDHSLRYDARNGNDRYCVSEPRTGDRAVLIAPCHNAATQYVTYDHGLYEFRDGRVLDDKAFGQSDGNPVLVFAYNGGANQHWSLPK
jgi:hypothetical protein